MKTLSFVSVFCCLVFGQIVLAQRSTLDEAQPNKVSCTEKAQSCVYDVRNSSAPKIIEIIKNTILEGSELVASKEGHLYAENKFRILFWHSDPIKLEAMKAQIPLLDVYDTSPPPAMIELSLMIFQATENGMANIQASLQNLQTGVKKGTTKIFDAATNSLTMNMGAAALATIIQGVRSTGELKFVQELHKTVENNSKFAVTKSMPVYISPNTVQSYTDKAGVSFSGEIALQRDEGHYILLKNCSISYSVKLGANDVDSMSVNEDALSLWDGNSSILVANVQKSTQAGHHFGLINFGTGSQSQYSKLMLVVTAHAVSADDYRKQNEQVSNMAPQSLVLTQSEIDLLPEHGDVTTALQGLKADASATADGTPILSFALDRTKLSRDSYNQIVKISVKGSGLKIEDYRDLQSLTLAPFKFSKDLKMSELQKPMLKFQLTIEPCKECGTHPFQSRTFDLIYLPSSQRLSVVK